MTKEEILQYRISAHVLSLSLHLVSWVHYKGADTLERKIFIKTTDTQLVGRRGDDSISQLQHLLSPVR